MIALVRGVSTRAMVVGGDVAAVAVDIGEDRRRARIDDAGTLAMKVRGVTTTSSPGPMPSALQRDIQRQRAVGQCDRVRVPHHAANSRSNSRHSLPVQ